MGAEHIVLVEGRGTSACLKVAAIKSKESLRPQFRYSIPVRSSPLARYARSKVSFIKPASSVGG